MRKFNVLIADDEEQAILGLEAGIDWDALNLNNLYKCHSKDSAVSILKVNPVDIIIADIEMPNGSGLELIKWVRENKPNIHTALYSGHAEFVYAQEALRLGVDDYLLKPIPYEEITAVLRRIEDKILKQEKSEGFSSASGGEDSSQIIDQVKKLIAENLSVGNLQRDELAALVHISPGYLGRIFKKETGMALTDYIIKKRISVAKQLLTKTSLSITSVSEKVGISYSSYFTKLFKEQVGMTPQEYRQLNQRGN